MFKMAGNLELSDQKFKVTMNLKKPYAKSSNRKNRQHAKLKGNRNKILGSPRKESNGNIRSKNIPEIESVGEELISLLDIPKERIKAPREILCRSIFIAYIKQKLPSKMRGIHTEIM